MEVEWIFFIASIQLVKCFKLNWKMYIFGAELLIRVIGFIQRTKSLASYYNWRIQSRNSFLFACLNTMLFSSRFTHAKFNTRGDGLLVTANYTWRCFRPAVGTESKCHDTWKTCHTNWDSFRFHWKMLVSRSVPLSHRPPRLIVTEHWPLVVLSKHDVGF